MFDFLLDLVKVGVSVVDEVGETATGVRPVGDSLTVASAVMRDKKRKKTSSGDSKPQNKEGK